MNGALLGTHILGQIESGKNNNEWVLLIPQSFTCGALLSDEV